MELGEVLNKYINPDGDTVVFRVPGEPDFESVYQFALDLVAEDTFILLGGEPPTREEELRLFKSWLDSIKAGRLVMIVVEVNGKFSGTAEIRIGSRRQTHVGDIGISLSPAVRRKGIGTAALNFLIDYARKLHLRILTIGCFENNTVALRLYRKLGFEVVGTIPEVIRYKGKYVGEVRMYMKL